MIKKMQINIGINEEIYSPNKVKNLICSLILETNDRGFAIESVTIDGVENFKAEKGFMNDLSEK